MNNYIIEIRNGIVSLHRIIKQFNSNIELENYLYEQNKHPYLTMVCINMDVDNNILKIPEIK